MKTFLSTFTKKENSLLIEYTKLFFGTMLPIALFFENFEIKKMSEIVTKVISGEFKDLLIFIIAPTIYSALRACLCKKFRLSIIDQYKDFEKIILGALLLSSIPFILYYFNPQSIVISNTIGFLIAFLLIPVFWHILVYDANDGYFKLLDELKLSKNNKRAHISIYFFIMFIGVTIGFYSFNL
ncbi:hypothetical protein [Bacteriovorax sp. Seq25_V]|uniref:hypothetical protein n=1 Tax=Bacteriovorax sp. Seq25_V TaxID=1201288 RepID=UPI00038A4BC2|nr:hypothetical protein [Bacteriovorax sp. Seq25_V]EQC47306.1 hypothetical protein M900_0486 [Bacteriovorax sp. Seq25_V]